MKRTSHLLATWSTSPAPQLATDVEMRAAKMLFDGSAWHVHAF